MHILWWLIAIIVYLFRPSCAWFSLGSGPGALPWMEGYHYPGYFTTAPSRFVNGTEVSDPLDTPDYRLEEPHFLIHDEKNPIELERPYRNSPNYKQAAKSYGKYFNIEKMMGCFCNTVYRKHILLAGCAVITSRHILTTATPTLLILRSYSHLPNLENILGGWYDHSEDRFNSSMYMTPARIHIHPKYADAHQVNVSHPIPAMFDLSVWASTHTFYSNTIFCSRAASAYNYYSHTIPQKYDTSIVAGFMFMKAYNRRPLPWYRYIIQTNAYVWPCPKSEWQWFHCVHGEYWGRYGFDSGGGMHSFYEDWRQNGMIGLCAFSMKLRSIQTVHYFTVIDNWPVLDFLYDAFLGLQKCAYMDDRFENTRWAAPRIWWGTHITINHYYGDDLYYSASIVPKYRR